MHMHMHMRMYIYAWVDGVVTHVEVRCDTVWWNLRRCAFEHIYKGIVHVCVCVCMCEYGLISMHALAWDALRLINIDSELSPLAGSLRAPD